ncbi:primosomal protein DnaI [Lactobacillus sp. ESL0701]|uniref:primosomal protein DnaI n=1 Tax=Lactobacillus sp. ESL0701 TaxID=2983217 RepID=UPI0023F6C45A|nr:primosomal protein DnaI [Lactobacillus sp. ESL0701]MDF7673082.1 primosomal protein DnaI [Lactobacillus sp. ESL0701]
MQQIGDILNKVNPEIKEKYNLNKIYQQVLTDPDIQKFIHENENKITQKMINQSLSNLYEYYSQRHNQDPVITGYRPELFLNHNAIDLRFVPDSNKLIRDRENNTKLHLNLIDLPEKLRKVHISEIDLTNERKGVVDLIIKFLSKYRRNPHQKGLYLEGNFGVGKTYILAGLANHVAAMNKNVVFLHVPTFIAKLSSHFEDNSLQNEIDRVSQCDLLILDDIGAETLSQWSRDDVLGVILQARMDNVLPTFFSSNIDMDKLEEHFKVTKNAVEPVKAARLMERIRTLAKEVEIKGKNRRR